MSYFLDPVLEVFHGSVLGPWLEILSHVSNIGTFVEAEDNTFFIRVDERTMRHLAGMHGCS